MVRIDSLDLCQAPAAASAAKDFERDRVRKRGLAAAAGPLFLPSASRGWSADKDFVNDATEVVRKGWSSRWNDYLPRGCDKVTNLESCGVKV